VKVLKDLILLAYEEDIHLTFLGDSDHPFNNVLLVPFFLIFSSLLQLSSSDAKLDINSYE